MRGYQHTFSHTLFAAPHMPLVHCSFNPLSSGSVARDDKHIEVLVSPALIAIASFADDLRLLL
jgi:hypothetical protein